MERHASRLMDVMLDELDSASRPSHIDRVLGPEVAPEMNASEFREIPRTGPAGRIAFVDGGRGVLWESPNCVIALNRACFSLFCGSSRLTPATANRVQFLSSIMLDVEERAGQKRIAYHARVFPHPGPSQLIPDEADLSLVTDRTSPQRSDQLRSRGMRFAEWKVAKHAVDAELRRGDLLIRDGSLQTRIESEAGRARDLYDAAREKGVIVCGISKTSAMITESGHPLLARAAEIAKETDHGRWYVMVAGQMSSDDAGTTLAVKLHEKSDRVYRLEILREQFDGMTEVEAGRVLGSIAENARDISMPGYPYGGIDADRFAQVRASETGMYRGMLKAKMARHPAWHDRIRDEECLTMHEVLNEVSA